MNQLCKQIIVIIWGIVDPDKNILIICSCVRVETSSSSLTPMPRIKQHLNPWTHWLRLETSSSSVTLMNLVVTQTRLICLRCRSCTLSSVISLIRIETTSSIKSLTGIEKKNLHQWHCWSCSEHHPSPLLIRIADRHLTYEIIELDWDIILIWKPCWLGFERHHHQHLWLYIP